MDTNVFTNKRTRIFLIRLNYYEKPRILFIFHSCNSFVHKFVSIRGKKTFVAKNLATNGHEFPTNKKHEYF